MLPFKVSQLVFVFKFLAHEDKVVISSSSRIFSFAVALVSLVSNIIQGSVKVGFLTKS
jgi:hypothetical protein